MRRHEFTRIIQIAAMNREDVGQIAVARQAVADRTGGHGEMGVDHIERFFAHQGFAPSDRGRHIGKERRQAAGGFLRAPVDRHADDARALFEAFLGKVEGFGGQNGDVMPFGEFIDQLRRDDPATAAKGRILVVTDQNVHVGMIRQKSEFPVTLCVIARPERSFDEAAG